MNKNKNNSFSVENISFIKNKNLKQIIGILDN